MKGFRERFGGLNALFQKHVFRGEGGPLCLLQPRVEKKYSNGFGKAAAVSACHLQTV